MKKTLTLIILLCLVFTMGIMPTSAVSEADESILNCHVNDIEANIAAIIKEAKIIKYKENRLEFTTDKKVRTTILENGTLSDQYIKSNLQVIPENDITMESLSNQFNEYITLSDSFSNYKYKWDTSYTVKIYTTLYYSIVIQSGREMVKIDRIVGGYTASGLNGTTIIENKISYGQTGFTIGGYKTQNYLKTFAITTNSWTVYPLSSWVPVANNDSSIVGGYYWMKLKRPSGYTWNVGLENNVF